MLIVVLVVILPLVLSACIYGGPSRFSWRKGRRDSAGLAPDPASTEEAVLQVYAARAVSWRGIFAVHTWIAMKPTGATKFSRYEVVGFGVSATNPAIRVDRTGPDNYWFGGAKPVLLLDRRGQGVDALIDRVRAAIAAYPYRHEYRAWPGPNSNTFTAYVARAVPELHLELPSIAIGKDYLPDSALFAPAPSATGYQISLYGVVGLLVAAAEGIELNLLGLDIGVDFNAPALKLPGIGRIGATLSPAWARFARNHETKSASDSSLGSLTRLG